MNSISFPKLNLSFEIDPILIHYKNGGGIHWYGVIIAVGILLAISLCSHIYKKRGRDPEELLDFLLCVLPVGIVGARAYYVVFSWDSYKNSLSEIFKIWHGGLAIYGGLIAGLIAAIVFCRVRGLSFPEFADVAVLGVVVGQCVGRWGNFVNGEAYGGETDLPWGMVVNAEGPVHPTFLYESLWSLAGLCLLLIVLKKGFASGTVLYSYLIWYGGGRFFIEGLRSDSLYTSFGVRVSQIVAAVSVVAGICGLVWLKLKKKDALC